MTPGWNRVVKRALDLMMSMLGTVALSPVLLTAALRIAASRDGPVVYGGLRVGLDGKPFRMYKFRTMVANADRAGGPHSPADDPRLTAVGKSLRRYKLDELPQLFNVIKGEMSLVGPRPQVPQEVATYTQEERIILRVKPGITDWSSLRFHDEAEILRGSPDPDRVYREVIRPEKMRLGMRYAQEWSVKEDLQILLATAALVIGRGRSTRRARTDG